MFSEGRHRIVHVSMHPELSGADILHEAGIGVQKRAVKSFLIKMKSFGLHLENYF